MLLLASWFLLFLGLLFVRVGKRETLAFISTTSADSANFTTPLVVERQRERPPNQMEIVKKEKDQ